MTVPAFESAMYSALFASTLNPHGPPMPPQIQPIFCRFGR